MMIRSVSAGNICLSKSCVNVPNASPRNRIVSSYLSDYVLHTKYSFLQKQKIGTQFNVEAYADDKTITATLVEGSIAMAYENKKSNWTEQEIQPGQEIVYTAAQQQIKIDQADVEVITSWKDGKLIFRDTPFKEVLKMLSKRFDVDFVVKNPKCFEASFTGVLEKQRLGRILEYISVSSNIKFKYAESNNIHQEKQKIEVY